jgi:hypothetical protein
MTKLLRPLSLAAAALVVTDFVACDGRRTSGPQEQIVTSASTAADSSTSLLVCPSDRAQEVSGLIGPAGGSLSVGGTTISLPVGALSVATPLKLTIPASNYMQVDVVAGDAEHLIFDRLVSITLDYSRCGDDAAGPHSVWYIDQESKALLEPMGGADDQTAHRITFNTGHLSSYAVAH